MKRYFLILPLLLIAGLYLNWQLSTPSHDRDWRADHARVPTVAVNDGLYVLGNIRNWSYGPDGTITKQDWITRDIVASDLIQTYFVLEPFGGIEAIAHTMMAFEFANGEVFIASIEARREIGETYQPIKAAVLPVFEYMFVWTTERDMYGNSEFYAKDPLYMFALSIPLDQQQAVLKAMLDETADVQNAPRWYNTLFSNCTNVLARTVNAISPGAVPFDVSWVLPGYSDEFLYKLGVINDVGTLEDTIKQAHISPLIPAAYANTDPVEFSQALRAALDGR